MPLPNPPYLMLPSAPQSKDPKMPTSARGTGGPLPIAIFFKRLSVLEKKPTHFPLGEKNGRVLPSVPGRSFESMFFIERKYSPFSVE